MGTVWIEGQFKNVTQPVKIEGNSGLTIDLNILENYATKEDLKGATTTASDYNELNETLEIK